MRPVQSAIRTRVHESTMRTQSTGSPATSQQITINGGWLSPARLHLIAQANAPVAGLPARRVFEGRHTVADLTLPDSRVLYDYLEEGASAESASRTARRLMPTIVPRLPHACAPHGVSPGCERKTSEE